VSGVELLQLFLFIDCSRHLFIEIEAHLVDHPRNGGDVDC
jgi:hypothetical protein